MSIAHTHDADAGPVAVAPDKFIKRLIADDDLAQGAGGVQHVPFAVIAARQDAQVRHIKVFECGGEAQDVAFAQLCLHTFVA